MSNSILPSFSPASSFVPANLVVTDWASVQPLYQSLIDRPLRCENCLEQLILDRSELDAASAEAGTNLYIHMTCHTDDPEATKAYTDFAENVQSELKKVGFELDRKITSSPMVGDLPAERYGVYLRDLRAAVELFRPENIPLQTEETKLETQYQTIIGAMTVEFDGKTQTLPQMAKYQELPDRSIREAAWKTVVARRMQDAAEIEDIFDKLLLLRAQIAKNAGFDNYRDFAFKARGRFDYSPADCHAFASGVERVVVPALTSLTAQRASALGLATVKPWDTAVDVKGRAPLRPFTSGDDLFSRTQRVFNRLDPDLGHLFSTLSAGGCLDLDSRTGKGPGGYQATRDRQRTPFIFMNAAGMQSDVETMVHEAGHAFHALLSRADPLMAYRSGIPIEFCEVASMSMELLTHGHLDEFYTPADAARARRTHLEGIARILPWIATIDQFQHWLYTNPGHSRADRAAAWNALMDRFGGGIDWAGHESARACLWHRQSHLFGSPFYYIEYGIAQLGALQLYGNFKHNPAQALTSYKSALALGGSKPLPSLFAAAGLDFDFSPAKVANTWRAVEQDLVSLPH